MRTSWFFKRAKWFAMTTAVMSKTSFTSHNAKLTLISASSRLSSPPMSTTSLRSCKPANIWSKRLRRRSLALPELRRQMILKQAYWTRTVHSATEKFRLNPILVHNRRHLGLTRMKISRQITTLCPRTKNSKFWLSIAHPTFSQGSQAWPSKFWLIHWLLKRKRWF